jgi:hypothetical protein
LRGVKSATRAVTVLYQAFAAKQASIERPSSWPQHGERQAHGSEDYRRQIELVSKSDEDDLNRRPGDSRERRPQSNPNQYCDAACYTAGKQTCRVCEIARHMRYGG